MVKSDAHSFARKMRFAKAMKTNRRIPRWIALKQDATKTRWNAQKHYWRRSHLKL